MVKMRFLKYIKTGVVGLFLVLLFTPSLFAALSDPFVVYGYVLYGDDSPVVAGAVTVTAGVAVGEEITNASGQYSTVLFGWLVGDLITVAAEKDGQTGTASAILIAGGGQQIDLKIYPVPLSSTATPTPLATSTITPTSSTDVPKTAVVLAYPNPGKDIIRFVWEERNAEKARISIYSIAGRLITTLKQDLPGQTTVWDVNAVAPGLYFYQVTLIVNGQERKLAVQKVVVEK